MELNFEKKKFDRKTRMQCAQLQLRWDSPELRDGRKIIPARHSLENLQHPVESLWLRGAKSPSNDELRETKATWRENYRQFLR